MLLFVVLCQALVDEPADALRFENRSETSILAERLAVLESQATQREVRIEALERRLREMERQQPAPRRGPDAPKVFRHLSGQWPAWDVQWLQSELRLQENGELTRQEPEPLGSTEPQPHRVRGTWMQAWGNWDAPSHMQMGPGKDIAEYWIAPPVNHWGNPLEHGLILGTEGLRLPQEERTIFDALRELLQFDTGPMYFGVAR